MWTLPVAWGFLSIWRPQDGQTSFMVAYGPKSKRKLPGGSFMAFDDLVLGSHIAPPLPYFIN